MRAMVITEPGGPEVLQIQHVDDPVPGAGEVLIRVEAFGINQIGMHDDFFEIGGTSLLAIQILSRLRDSLHVQLSVPQLFETLTIAGLAQLVRSIAAQERGLRELEHILDEIEPVPPEANLGGARASADEAGWKA